MSQEHDGQELTIALLSHTFTDTQWKWNTTEQETYGIYYAVTKWNYYQEGSDVFVCIDHKPLQKFINGKNANNKVNIWSLELIRYNITFEWIYGACNKAAGCLSRLVDAKDTPVTSIASIKMIVISTSDSPATCTHSKTGTPTDTTPPADVQNTSNTDKVSEPPSFMEDHKDTLHLMQRTDPFCKCISKLVLNGKVLSHETDTFIHIKGLF